MFISLLVEKIALITLLAFFGIATVLKIYFDIKS
jgi:hypothetical protein